MESLVLRIDWSDIDALGHVNNLAILRYAQSARAVLCEKAGVMRNQPSEQYGTILLSVNCRYFQPLFYPGTVTVRSTVTKIGTTSFCLTHQILNEKNELAAQAEDVLVYYDYHNGTKVKLPDEFCNRLRKYFGDC